MKFHQRFDRILSEKKSLEKISQAEIARKLGVKRSTITDWKKGRTEPSVEIIPLLAEVLGVSIVQLVGEEKKQATNGPDNLIILPIEDFNIPIYTTIKAGNGEMGIADGEINGFVSICSDYKRQKVFAIKVSGDSMATDLYDGEIAIFILIEA